MSTTTPVGGTRSADRTADRTDDAVAERTDVREPPFYKVLLLNDDFTPMDFVVELLVVLFGKNVEEATKIMLHVHHRGQGICGVYPKEIAEMKVLQVEEFARERHHPLRCRMERS
jgi:ATP-dependent Clp protease adaptor protein ClpS